jgi:hypothetical protein
MRAAQLEICAANAFGGAVPILLRSTATFEEFLARLCQTDALLPAAEARSKILAAAINGDSDKPKPKPEPAAAPAPAPAPAGGAAGAVDGKNGDAAAAGGAAGGAPVWSRVRLIERELCTLSQR